MPRLSALLLTTLLIAGLAGCGGTPIPPTRTPAPTATQTPVPAPSATPAPTRPSDGTKTLVFPMFIVYTGIVESGAEIFSLDLTADPPRLYQLTETEGAAYRPRWSPDLRYLAYIYAPPDATAAELWLFDNMEGGMGAVSAGIPGLDDFVWTPDGRYLVYAADQPDGVERDIYRIEVESGEVVNLTADSSVWDSAPAASPDGQSLAFVSDRAPSGKGMDNIWVMGIDGSDPRNLTDSDWEDVSPGWSPDGAWIAFYRWSVAPAEEGGPAGLWVMRADGGEARLLAGLGDFLAGLDAPVYSPDGLWIAYQGGIAGDSDVYVIPAEGGEPVNVSNMAGHDYAISWRADSQSLTFTHEGEEGLTLYVAAPDGTDTASLLGGAGNGLGEWAPLMEVYQ